MPSKALTFELFTAGSLILGGATLFMLGLAASGLLVVGCLLLVFTLTRYRAWLPVGGRSPWRDRAMAAASPARQGLQ
ncbi:MAG: hypothetical protein RLZZ385_1268 [Pseudomonadota bacterium]|jgi:hypothetical protein